MVISRFAGDIAEVIRVNPIPWLFAPGIGLAGYWLGGMSGVVQALGGWSAIVTGATGWVILRRRFWPDQIDAHRDA